MTQTVEKQGDTQGSAVRRIGLELEFAGLTEEAAARTFADAIGGAVRHEAPRAWICDSAEFGACEVYLDTRFDDKVAALGDTAVAAMRHLVPVELVTEPFDPAHLRLFNDGVEALREAGAIGSRDGLFLGFGLHLNVEIAAETADHLWRVLTAYALLEEHLRAAHPIDISRRVLPFVRPYPDGLVDALATTRPDTVERLIDLYLDHAPSRDHGLDILPIFKGIDAGRVDAAVHGLTAVKPRPAYHFRLPDCRIDEDGWTVMPAWEWWNTVEAVAADDAQLEALRAARRDWNDRPALGRRPWHKEAAETLDRAAKRAAS
jgi:hypothetical protein